MRALILTGSPNYSRAALQLVDEQIVAGPDWPDAQTLDGCWLSLRTPVGEYDLAALLGKIPDYQRPEAVVCMLDSSWRSMPRNLRCFPHTRILVLSDAAGEMPDKHDLFNYVSLEPFERVMFRKDQKQLQRFLATPHPVLPLVEDGETWNMLNPQTRRSA